MRNKAGIVMSHLQLPRPIEIKMKEVLNLSGATAEQVKSLFILPVNVVNLNLERASKTAIKEALLEIKVEQFSYVAFPEDPILAYWVGHELTANSRIVPSPICMTISDECYVCGDEAKHKVKEGVYVCDDCITWEEFS